MGYRIYFLLCIYPQHTKADFRNSHVVKKIKGTLDLKFCKNLDFFLNVDLWKRNKTLAK